MSSRSIPVWGRRGIFSCCATYSGAKNEISRNLVILFFTIDFERPHWFNGCHQVVGILWRDFCGDILFGGFFLWAGRLRGMRRSLPVALSECAPLCLAENK